MSAALPNKNIVVPRAVQITMLVALVAGFWFIKPFIGVVLLSALIAFAFNPIYKLVFKRTKRQGLAIIVSMLTAIISLIVPIAVVVLISINQANTLISSLHHQNVSFGSAQVAKLVDSGTQKTNELIKSTPLGDNISLTPEKVNNSAKKLATAIAQGFINLLKQAGGALSSIISMTILAFFMISAMWRYQKEIITYLKQISPLEDDITNRYLIRTAAMTKAMVKGQLIIALVQGLAGAVSLLIVGVDYFWFFFVVLSFLCFIPLGSGILTIPLGLVLIVTNGWLAGIFVLAFHFLIVTNIDNILRPHLVPKQARLNSALLLLSVFSGLLVFGPLGVVYGPVVMIILTTTFEMYGEYVRRLKKQRSLVADSQ